MGLLTLSFQGGATQTLTSYTASPYTANLVNFNEPIENKHGLNRVYGAGGSPVQYDAQGGTLVTTASDVIGTPLNLTAAQLKNLTLGPTDGTSAMFFYGSQIVFFTGGNDNQTFTVFSDKQPPPPSVRFDRDVAPGNWHLLKVACHVEDDARSAEDLDWDATHHRSILVKMRDLKGNDLFHRGGVMHGLYGTYVPSAFVAAQTARPHRPWATERIEEDVEQYPAYQGYAEDAVFASDSVVQGIQFDLRFMNTLTPVEAVRHFSLTFQVPCSSDQFMSDQ